MMCTIISYMKAGKIPTPRFSRNVFTSDISIFLLTQEEEVNLGTKDSKAKEYLSDNTRFSEICNYVLFDGEKVIKPENLKECDTTEVLSVFGIDRKQIVKQKWRDFGHLSTITGLIC